MAPAKSGAAETVEAQPYLVPVSHKRAHEPAYANAATAADPGAEPIHGNVIPQPSNRSQPPAEHTYVNLGNAAPLEEEPIYAEIDSPQSTPPPAQPQWRTRTVAQPNSRAAETVEAQPYLVPLSHKVDPGQAYRELALAHLQAVGVADPELELVHTYRRHVQGETEFEVSVRTEEKLHLENIQRQAYQQAIHEIADGNREFLDSLSQYGSTEEERSYLGGQTYARYVAQQNSFVGPTTTEILRSFDDQPAEIHERVCKEVLAFGRTPAAGTERGSPPQRPDANRV